jgi:hypothetical protein
MVQGPPWAARYGPSGPGLTENYRLIMRSLHRPRRAQQQFSARSPSLATSGCPHHRALLRARDEGHVMAEPAKTLHCLPQGLGPR